MNLIRIVNKKPKNDKEKALYDILCTVNNTVTELGVNDIADWAKRIAHDINVMHPNHNITVFVFLSPPDIITLVDILFSLEGRAFNATILLEKVTGYLRHDFGVQKQFNFDAE